MKNIQTLINETDKELKNNNIFHQFPTKLVLELYYYLKNNNITTEKNFFDIGCGHGAFSMLIKECFPNELLPSKYFFIDPFEKTKKYNKLNTTNDLRKTIEVNMLHEKKYFYQTVKEINSDDISEKNIYCYGAMDLFKDFNYLKKYIKKDDIFVLTYKPTIDNCDFYDLYKKYAINEKSDKILFYLTGKLELAFPFINYMLTNNYMIKKDEGLFIFNKECKDLDLEKINKTIYLDKGKLEKYFLKDYVKIMSQMTDHFHEIVC